MPTSHFILVTVTLTTMIFSHSFSFTLGLGHLISCILINGAQYFKRISESGIKKMCRNIFVLQQNLTNITMSREADLDFARYESHPTSTIVSHGIVHMDLRQSEALYLYLHRCGFVEAPNTGL